MSNSKFVQNETALVVYPREYVVDEDNGGNGKDYVLGVDVEGRDVKVTLQYSREVVQRAQANKDLELTSVDKLADDTRQATRPCYCDENNGPENPVGVLFFERLVSPEFAGKKSDKEISEVPQFREVDGVREYSAGWVSVLAVDCADRKSPDVHPVSGKGYVSVTEMNPRMETQEERDAFKQETNALKAELEGLRKQYILTKGDERDQVGADILEMQSRIDDMYAYKIASVYPKLDEAVMLQEATGTQITEAYRDMYNKYTKDGHFGGVMLRFFKDDETVIKEMTFDLAPFWQSGVGVVGPDEVIEDWMKWKRGREALKLASERDFKVEVIPTQRINCGPKGNEFYNKPENGLKGEMVKVRKTYFNDMGEAQLRGIVSRVACAKRKEDRGNQLLGEVHTTTQVQGPVMAAKADGTFYKVYSTEKQRILKKAAAPVEAKPSRHTDGDSPTPS